MIGPATNHKDVTLGPLPANQQPPGAGPRLRSRPQTPEDAMEALRALLVPALLPEICFEAMRERPLHGAGRRRSGGKPGDGAPRLRRNASVAAAPCRTWAAPCWVLADVEGLWGGSGVVRTGSGVVPIRSGF